MHIYKLPLPPSLNRIWRAVNGGVKLSKDARTWNAKAAAALPTGRVVTLKGRLRVTIFVHGPLKLKAVAFDIGNREKILCDLLTKQRVWEDDSQIDELLIFRGACEGQGFVVVQIEELT